jgi:hypothetical protein
LQFSIILKLYSWKNGKHTCCCYMRIIISTHTALPGTRGYKLLL